MKTCLIVDDVEVTRFTGKIFVEELGLKSVEASNVEEALANISSADVILMDWHIKQESGLDLLKKLRADGNNVPVIMFSAVEGNDKLGEAKQAGASGFIQKPTTKEKIEEQFKNIGIL